MQISVRSVVLTVFALVLLPARAQASSIVLYQQVPDFPAPSSFRTSYGTSSQTFFRTSDNFTLTQGGVVTNVTWQGSYQDFVNSQNPAAPNTVSFDIAFWADASGQPGASLLSQTIAYASVTATLVGFSATGLNVFDYQVALPTPFLAQPGTTYWLSIFSNSSSFSPLWGWRSGSGGDGLTFQQNFSTGGSTLTGPDRAFALVGAPVPEPGSVVLLVSGLAAIALIRRRRG